MADQSDYSGSYTGGLTIDIPGGAANPPADDLNFDFTGPGYTDQFWNWLLSTYGTQVYQQVVNNASMAAGYYTDFVDLGSPDVNNPETPPTPGGLDPNNDLLTSLTGFLNQYGLGGMLDWVKEALTNGWSEDRIYLEMKNHEVWRDRFKGNTIRFENGYSQMTEAEYLTWENDAKRLAKIYGFQDPGSDYIANAIGGNKSVREIEEEFQIGRRVAEFGPQVKGIFEGLLGINMSDQNLAEFFDPNKSTPMWDDAYKKARLMGQPISFGLGQRSEAEANALIATGMDIDTIVGKYQDAGQFKDRFDRLTAMQQELAQGLPDNFGDFLKNVDNESLIDAVVFNTPEASANLQNLMIQAIGKQKGKGGPAGQGAGLLTPDQRAGL